MTYKTILAACDGTDLGNEAVIHAAGLAALIGASVSVITVSAPPPTFAASEIGWSIPSSVYDEIHTANAARAKRIFAEAARISGAEFKDSIHIENSGPAEAIIDVAGRIGADLIVMGSHGYRGISKLVLGSQAAKVLSHSSVPVLIVK